MTSRREFVVAAGVLAVAGCTDSEDAPPDDGPDDDESDALGIELLDHTARRTAGGGVEIEVTLENRADEERSVDITISVYDGETLLDETLLRMTTPAGEQNTSSSVLVDLADVSAVTHYVFAVRRDPSVDPADAPLRREYDGDRLRDAIE